ncbi:MAG TPA: type VI secretion system baseplate subunit TssG [Rhodocyclaceae bacterium]|nr:type VI secretion system baseplate subunit TssG [Rhodocyclaceae bacterium]
MAAPGWRTADPLARRLRQDYAHIDFYQLVRLLLAERRQQAGGTAPTESVTARELDAAVRFGANLEGAFPGREVCGLQDGKPEDGGKPASGPAEVAVNNYCIAGAQGPLPDPYTEWVRDQVREGNGDTAAFLDLFNHRFNALRYRLKARHRPVLEGTAPEKGRIADYLSALMGMLGTELSGQAPLPRRALLGLAGLLSNARRSPPVLLAALRTYLGVPVALQPFQGNWRPIEKSDRMALGRSNCRLGQNSFAGTRIWDEHAEISLVVGPIDYSRFVRLLPEKKADYSQFANLVRYLLDRRHDCRVIFLVRGGEAAPQRQLTVQPEAGRQGLYLGHTAWCAADETAPEALRQVEIHIRAFPERRAA